MKTILEIIKENPSISRFNLFATIMFGSAWLFGWSTSWEMIIVAIGFGILRGLDIIIIILRYAK